MISRYITGLFIQIFTKLTVGLVAIGWGFGTGDLPTGLLGCVILMFTIDFSRIEHNEIQGEYPVIQILRDMDSGFSAQFLPMQLALYFLSDREAFNTFVHNFWATAKEQAPAHILAELLFYVFLSAAFDSEINLSDSFHQEARNVLMDWIPDIQVSSLFWWSLCSYIVWSRVRNRPDDVEPVLILLREEWDSTDMPAQFLHDMRVSPLEFLITFGESGTILRSSSGKGKFKLLYRNCYCGLFSPYDRAYRQVTAYLDSI